MAGTEIRIGVEAIPLGGMRQAESGDDTILFVRDADGVRAFQAKCPHYGAPLAKGAICGRRLYCPWHKAAFDIGDGGLVEPPALTALDRYPVRIEGDEAVATLDALPAHAAPPRGQGSHVVVVGTGAAAVAAVTTLRREGFAGPITMIGREGHPPYDRPMLSKTFLAKKTPPEQALLEPDFDAAHRVERVDGSATRIDPASRTVTLADGRAIVGDALLIATGSRAVVPDFPGYDREGVHTLRSLDDATRLSAAADGKKRVVIVGGGFIGLEAAASLTKRGLEATVVAGEALPLSKRFGEPVAAGLKAFHEGNGIRFRHGKVARFTGGSAVTAVDLADGTSLPADLVLIGAGAVPETEAIVGVERREDGGIDVRPDLSIAERVWCAGDIAAFSGRGSGARARIEHWRLAQQHGMHVARAILGEQKPFAGTPFFWSNQGAKRLDYAGFAPAYDRMIVKGDPGGLDFIAYYVKDGRTIAACSIGRNADFIDVLHRLGEARAPSPEELDGA